MNKATFSAIIKKNKEIARFVRIIVFHCESSLDLLFSNNRGKYSTIKQRVFLESPVLTVATYCKGGKMMKKHIVVPVSYKEAYYKDVRYVEEEVSAFGFNDEKNKDFLKGLSGSLAIEALLDAGWTILSVQTAQIPANASDYPRYVKGGVIFHYILESPEIE